MCEECRGQTWCVAGDGRAGGNISHSRRSGTVWCPGVCVGAGPGMMRWQRTSCSEDTCGPLPLYAFWNESACQTWRRRSVDKFYTYKQKTHRDNMVPDYCRLSRQFNHPKTKKGKVIYITCRFFPLWRWWWYRTGHCQRVRSGRAPPKEKTHFLLWSSYGLALPLEESRGVPRDHRWFSQEEHRGHRLALRWADCGCSKMAW